MWKRMFSIAVVLVLALANCVLAADISWSNLGLGNSFCTAENWVGGFVPGLLDTAIIDVPPAEPNSPVIDCVGTVNKVYGPIYQAVDVTQSMDIVSGTLTTKKWAVVADGGGTATINISGGTVTVGDWGNWEPALRDSMSLEPFEGIDGEDKKTIINLTDNADVTIWTDEVGILLAKEENAELEMNISGNAELKIPAGKRAWMVANNGTAVVNISDNAQVNLGGRMSFCEGSSGYAELHMSGSLLSVLVKYVNLGEGSGILDFSGGTADLKGIAFDGSLGKWCKVNIRGTADVSAYESVSLSKKPGSQSWLNISDSGSLSAPQLYMAPAGDEGAECTLNMTGGTVNATVNAPADPNGKANINLHGGTINCGAFNHDGADWHMDICGGGTMIIDGDVKAEIEGYVADGHIAACLGAQGHCVCVNYDTINPGKTTVQQRFCAGDMDGNCQRTLADLDALVNVLVNAGPPFIAPCCE